MKISTSIYMITLTALVGCSGMPPPFSSIDPIPEKKYGEFGLILNYDLGDENFEIQKTRTCSYLGRKRIPTGSYINQWESIFKDGGPTGKGILLKSLDEDNNLYYYLNTCQTLMTRKDIDSSRDAFLSSIKGRTYTFSRIRSEELFSKYKIKIKSFSENEITPDAPK